MEADSLEWLSKTRGSGRERQRLYHELVLDGDKVSEMLQAFRSFIGENQMMALRLKELHRVITATRPLRIIEALLRMRKKWFRFL